MGALNATNSKVAEPRRRRIVKRSAAWWQDWAAIRVFDQLRDALLRGEAVTLPGIGRIEVTKSQGYTIKNPISGETRRVTVAKKVRYQPARTLLRDLEAANSDGG